MARPVGTPPTATHLPSLVVERGDRRLILRKASSGSLESTVYQGAKIVCRNEFTLPSANDGVGLVRLLRAQPEGFLRITVGPVGFSPDFVGFVREDDLRSIAA